jgi:transposase
MIVIGADIHKSTHALAAVSADGGTLAGEREIRADEAGHRAALHWARKLDRERVWAIEDCRHLSRRFEQALLAAGERVVRVPPRTMGTSRRSERESGKSDQIDARAVACAVVREGVECFAAAFLDERALEIRLVCDHRSDLVAERQPLIRRPRRRRWFALRRAMLAGNTARMAL